MVREKEIALVKSTKPLYIRLQLPSGGAISAPPLSATLGQVQINSSEFCKVFNNFSTQLYEDGVLLNVDLFKKADNTYYFFIRGISLPFLLFQVSDAARNITVEELFDVFRLKSLTSGKNLNFQSAKLYFGALRTIKFRILL